MSYVRWGEDGSHVYAYENCNGMVSVWADSLLWANDLTYREAVTALLAARERGLCVPQYAIDALIFDADNAVDVGNGGP